LLESFLVQNRHETPVSCFWEYFIHSYRYHSSNCELEYEQRHWLVDNVVLCMLFAESAKIYNLKHLVKCHQHNVAYCQYSMHSLVEGSNLAKNFAW